MGGGDVKLTAASGFVLGLSEGCVGTIMGLSVLLLWYITVRAVYKTRKIPLPSAIQTALPLAPFLSVGFIGAMILELSGYL